MGNKIKLELTPADLDSLSVSSQSGRGKVARVPKALLLRLLIDHGRLIRYVKGHVEVLEGHT